VRYGWFGDSAALYSDRGTLTDDMPIPVSCHVPLTPLPRVYVFTPLSSWLHLDASG